MRKARGIELCPGVYRGERGREVAQAVLLKGRKRSTKVADVHKTQAAAAHKLRLWVRPDNLTNWRDGSAGKREHLLQFKGPGFSS